MNFAVLASDSVELWRIRAEPCHFIQEVLYTDFFLDAQTSITKRDFMDQSLRQKSRIMKGKYFFQSKIKLNLRQFHRSACVRGEFLAKTAKLS